MHGHTIDRSYSSSIKFKSFLAERPVVRLSAAIAYGPAPGPMRLAWPLAHCPCQRADRCVGQPTDRHVATGQADTSNQVSLPMKVREHDRDARRRQARYDPAAVSPGSVSQRR
jgi:hypothetical protein